MSRLAYVFTLAVALVGTSAHAGGKKDKEKALALFEKSDKAYKDGKFEEAARLLRDAYALFPEPILLYNLGRAQEGLGDVEGAITSYERYLSDATEIADRGAIERRVATLKAQLAARDEEARRLADEEAKRRKAEAERQRAEAERLRLERQAREDRRSPLEKYGPWITIGTGGAALGTGLYFGARASSTHDDAVASPVQRDALELQHSAERSAKIANVMFIVGGVVAAGGIGWKMWQWRAGSSSSASTTASTASLRAAPGAITLEGTW